MRTTVELPDDLMLRARAQAQSAGLTLRELLIEAVELRLNHPRRARRPPPIIGNASAPPIGPLTRQQIDEAAFG
jgi:hypothetical protein